MEWEEKETIYGRRKGDRKESEEKLEGKLGKGGGTKGERDGKILRGTVEEKRRIEGNRRKASRKKKLELEEKREREGKRATEEKKEKYTRNVSFI